MDHESLFLNALSGKPHARVVSDEQYATYVRALRNWVPKTPHTRQEITIHRMYRFCVARNELVHKQSHKVVVAQSALYAAIRDMHVHPNSNIHSSSAETYVLVHGTYWNITREQVSLFVQTCSECANNKLRRGYVEWLQSSSCLVYVDGSSGYYILVATTTTELQTLAGLLCTRVFCVYGIPDVLCSSRDDAFLVAIRDQVCALLQIATQSLPVASVANTVFAQTAHAVLSQYSGMTDLSTRCAFAQANVNAIPIAPGQTRTPHAVFFDCVRSAAPPVVSPPQQAVIVLDDQSESDHNNAFVSPDIFDIDGQMSTYCCNLFVQQLHVPDTLYVCTSFLSDILLSLSTPFCKQHRCMVDVQLFALDALILPVLHANHWVLLVVIGLQEGYGRVLFFNSLSAMPAPNLDGLYTFLDQEWIIRHPFRTALESTHKFPILAVRVPQQVDATSCGVYMLECLERIVNDSTNTLLKRMASGEDNFLHWFSVHHVQRKRQELLLLASQQQ